MATSAPVVGLLGLRKSFLHRPVLDDVSLTIHEGDRIGLIGRNGSGKTTLMGIIAGTVELDAGELHFRRGVTVGALDQAPAFDPEQTLGAWLDGAFTRVRDLQAEIDDLHHRIDDEHSPESARLLERLADATHELERLGAYDIESRTEAARRALGLPETDRPLGRLSGGERRRAALCRVLLERPDLLLLDEPTNHLDAAGLEWLEEYLARYSGTVVFVSHDRTFMDNVATRMIELERGRATSYDGNYEDYLVAKEEEARLAAREEDNRRLLLRHELVWLAKRPKARTTKSKSRIDRVMELIAAEPEEAASGVDLRLPDPPYLGNVAIEAENLRRAVAGRELFGGFGMMIGPGERVCILGPNGAGKSTLVKALLRIEPPDTGDVRHGANLSIVYADQERATLDQTRSVLEEVAGDVEWLLVNGERITVRAYLKRFLFTDETAAMPVGRLSGGERNRVLLAKLLRTGGNMIALDEPTNDLDLHTLRVLEEALAAFPGCALIVSHDRTFVNRIATRILWLPGDGTVHDIAGNYDDFQLYRARRAAAQTPAAKPAPVAPKPRESTAPAASKKLSNREQREYDTMEETILLAEERAAELESRVADPSSFSRATGDEVRALLADRDAAVAEVERLYARWAELSERAR